MSITLEILLAIHLGKQSIGFFWRQFPCFTYSSCGSRESTALFTFCFLCIFYMKALTKFAFPPDIHVGNAAFAWVTSKQSRLDNDCGKRKVLVCFSYISFTRWLHYILWNILLDFALVATEFSSDIDIFIILFILHLLTHGTFHRCIPFKYRDWDDGTDDEPKKIVEVLMINSQSGPGLLFPKVK